jgi:hypothetical protein
LPDRNVSGQRGAVLHAAGTCRAPVACPARDILIGGASAMDFERYYLELFDILNRSCKKIASGKYDQQDADRLLELAKDGRYPGFLTDLAESFGMMMVKLEAREFQLNQTIDKLEKAKAELESRRGL